VGWTRGPHGRKHLLAGHSGPCAYLGAKMNVYRAMRLALDATRLVVKEKVQGKSRSERRAIARRKLIPSDCVCPECCRVVLESNRWVVSGGVSICKSCFQGR